jgi:hypothetical protein
MKSGLGDRRWSQQIQIGAGSFKQTGSPGAALNAQNCFSPIPGRCPDGRSAGNARLSLHHVAHLGAGYGLDHRRRRGSTCVCQARRIASLADRVRA